MAIVAEWKSEVKGIFKADATKVADEIMSIGEAATPRQILELGRNKNTELHKCFEWNDGIAAEKYRVIQARNIVRCLVVKQPEETSQEIPEVRFFHVTQHNEGYQPISLIIQDQDQYEKLLKQAMDELQAFKRKYNKLEEFREILDLIP